MSDLIDLVGHTLEGMSVWRYLLSPSYRRVIHARWRAQPRIFTVADIFGYVGSFVLVTSVMVAGVLWWLG